MDRKTLTPPGGGLSTVRVRAFVTDVGALGMLQVLMRVQGLVLLPILARSFGVEAYGIWAEFFVALQLLSVIVSFSLDDPLIRFVAGASTRDVQSEHYHTMMALVVGANLAAAVVLLAWPQPFAFLLFGSTDYALFIQLMAPTLVFEALDDLTLNMLRALQKAKLYVLLESSQAVVRIVALVVTLLVSRSLVAALLVNMGVQVVWLVIQLALNYKYVGFRWPRFTYLRESLAYSLPLIPARYSNLILAYSDRLVITHVYGPAAVGIYIASYDLAKLCWHVVLPLRLALQPVVSRLWDEGFRDDVAVLLSQSFKYSLLFGLPAVVGLTALAPHFFRLTATREFSEASVYIVPLAGGGILLNGIMGTFSLVMRLHKNTRAIALAIVTSAVIHLALNLFLIPRIGIIGGAISTLIGYAVELGLIVTQSWRHTRFPVPWRPAAIAIIGSAVMLPVVVWIVSWSGWVAIVLASVAGAAVYMASVMLMGAVTWRELRLVFKGAAA